MGEDVAKECHTVPCRAVPSPGSFQGLGFAGVGHFLTAEIFCLWTHDGSSPFLPLLGPKPAARAGTKGWYRGATICPHCTVACPRCPMDPGGTVAALHPQVGLEKQSEALRERRISGGWAGRDVTLQSRRPQMSPCAGAQWDRGFPYSTSPLWGLCVSLGESRTPREN